MTKAVVIRKNGKIVSAEVKGHSGYEDEGKDIVCAALSTAVQAAILGLLKVVGVRLDYTIDKKGYLKFNLSGEIPAGLRHDCDIVLETMLLVLQDIAEGYPRHVKLEVKEDVY